MPWTTHMTFKMFSWSYPLSTEYDGWWILFWRRHFRGRPCSLVLACRRRMAPRLFTVSWDEFFTPHRFQWEGEHQPWSSCEKSFGVKLLDTAGSLLSRFSVDNRKVSSPKFNWTFGWVLTVGEPSGGWAASLIVLKLTTNARLFFSSVVL